MSTGQNCSILTVHKPSPVSCRLSYKIWAQSVF